MKPREPLCFNRENAGVDWQNPQHSQDLATPATLEVNRDNSLKSMTSTLAQHFSYVCAGVGFWKRKTETVSYITHVELLRCVDVVEFIYIKVLQELLQSVASIADCKGRRLNNLGTYPPVKGPCKHLHSPRAGATPKVCQLNAFKNSVVRVVRVDAWLSQVNGSIIATLLGCGGLAGVAHG